MALKTITGKGKGKKTTSSSGEAATLPIISVLHSSAPIPPHGDIGSDTTQMGTDQPRLPILENLSIFRIGVGRCFINSPSPQVPP
ncbi:uncharacterized protein A4U43_C01F15470 [Asparagus officinalis]|uniref:Uncharacterized protein n=1 Tax=Asparagus officinalis TaxID=4686 RepID=A0A5P1FQ59_ASPOF|nr:uncharacterized protein A4U43_C01F15470 [Asparagus officinalis]